MVPMTAIRLQRATNAPLAVDVVLSAQTSSIENIAELGVARLSCSEDGCRLPHVGSVNSCDRSAVGPQKGPRVGRLANPHPGALQA